MNQPVTLKRKFIYAILAILPVVVAIIAVEMHLRAETRQWYEKKLSKNRALKNSLMIHRKSDDPLLIYELTPGAEVDKQGVHYKINQAGFRDEEFADPELNPKQADEYRIVVLGDSVAWGWGVNAAEVWPQVLEQNLKGAIPWKRVTVYNLAVNGYSTPQEVRVLAKAGMKYAPDLVILNYVLNDPEVEDGGLSWYFEAADRIEILYKGKLLFSFVSALIKSELGLVTEASNNSVMDHFYLTHHTDLFKNVERGFADLAAIANEQHLDVLVIVTPVFQFAKGQPYPWAEIHRKIAALSMKQHFLFLDTQLALSSFNASEVSFDPIHPNAEGHRIIAAAIKEKLTLKP